VAVVNEDSPQKILMESVGVFPAKVRAGEAYSILLDFNTGTSTGGATSTEMDALASNADGLLPRYQVELQAAGTTIDGAKRRVIFEVPATWENVWSCSFPSTGRQSINLLVKEVQPARDERGDHASYHPVFTYVHPVSVEGNFTLSTDNVIAVVGVLISAVTVLVNVLAHVSL
jgi:hypothetical protein